jgi:hypothetical protein
MKKVTRKSANDVQQHKEERIQFSLVDDTMGVIDLDVAAGEFFDNLVMVHLDDSIKSKLTLGKIYEYSAKPFFTAEDTEPMYMFATGIDDNDPELFSFEDKDYELVALYAFPADKLLKWAVKKQPSETRVMCYELPKDFDIEELRDFLEEIDDPEEAKQWLEEHGAKPHKGE